MFLLSKRFFKFGSGGDSPSSFWWMWIFWLWRLFVGSGDNFFFGNKRGMG